MALIIQFKDAHWLIVINKIQPLAIDKKHTLVAKMTHNKEKTKQIETEKKKQIETENERVEMIWKLVSKNKVKLLRSYLKKYLKTKVITRDK